MKQAPYILVVNGIKVRRPVFVLGAPLSGVELVGRALKRSAGFHVSVWQPSVLRMAYALARRPSIAEGRDDATARVIRDTFAEAWQISARNCADCVAQCRAAAGNSSYPCVSRSAVERFGDAGPDLIYSALPLVHAFTDARLIQVIRDGRDVVTDMLADEQALAWFKIPNVADEFPNPFFGVEDDADRTLWPELSTAGKAAMRWRGAVRLSARLRGELPREQLMTVRYEDLFRKQLEVAQSVSEFLDARMSAVELVRADRSGIGGWRLRLSALQHAEVDKVAGQELRRLGYV
ncbi:sulfotransferase [Allonocardiopsis opalescens]|uniref:Sulfotransferase family protein n=1 Tax=Allonocardiopsis opalescens TaxID=1144618 RepID=A0A2T0Q472_9ACTN|nr:sulfotransferase [Allonocardiopsis opalescens]PRX98604.1 sulfotransferase family protein [Allonocardiopsis opalescens]